MKMDWMKKIGVLTSITVVSGVLIYASTRYNVEPQVVQSYDLPKTIDFAGEKTPLNIADVKERLDREMITNVNYHSSTTLAIKRANRVFPIIESILKKNGIPDDFKYLAVIESGLVNVVSPAGARGIWQFMPQTAKEYGMEVNDFVDERYHLEKSTQAACDYLNSAKNKFGTWTLAAASYNGGVSGINKQIERQGESGYYDLLLTEETSRYVFRILALKEIMKNPVKYGFNIPNEQLYFPIETKQISVDSTVSNLASLAKSQGINYKILKIHNPWLRDTKLENKAKKIYTIDIPKEGY